MAFVAAVLLATAALHAQEPPDKPIREIFVPFEDLNILLESQAQRVFLTRQEFDALVEKAKAKPQSNVPHKLALVVAEYQAALEEGRAVITGNLTVDVLDDGLFALPLDLAGVGIRSAVLDGQPAPLVRGPLAPQAEKPLAEREAHQSDDQRPILLVQGKGPHKLALTLTAPLQTAAAHQALNVTLPTTTAARLKLTVPGNVEVKGGAAVIDRQFDMAANVTRLELMPQRGGMSIVLSLNNRLLQDQRVLVARSVLVDEVTQGYERIHATVSFRVLHGATDKLRLAVPAGFEVTRVESTLLARWEQKAEADGRKVLEATLREPTSEQIVLSISANRSPAADQDWLAALADWKFPRLTPLDVAGQVAVVGLLVEDRLRPENIAASGLLPIDAGVLAGAIPASVLKAEPGAPDVRQVVTYYAPAAEYDLTARFARPAAGLKVATNSLLVLSERNLTLTGGFALTPEAESLFDFRFTLPTGWQVKQVTRADGAALVIERYPTPDGGLRVLVRLGSGISVGQTATVNFEAVSMPAGWLAEWDSQAIEYPQIAVEGATRDTGAVAAQTLDDLVVRPDKLQGLTPLLDAEKAAFGLAELPTALAYRYQARPFSLSLAVERTKPSLMAEVYSLIRIERDNLIAHYELNYDVREARTRRLYFLLPKETPAEIAVKGLDSAVVKEFRSTDDGAWRRWEVQLAERQIGRVRLAVDFQQKYDDLGLSRLGVPLIQAAEVEYQSALVAVEGDEELDLSISTTARPVDVGELAGAQQAVGPRVIGAYGYVGNQASVLVNVSRREPYALPPALVQKARLTTKVAAAGRSQSLAEYDLLTKATLLEIRLPERSTLWTISIDGEPTKPQREGDSLLLSLPAQEQLAARKLKIVYETPGNTLGFSGTIESDAPVLLVRATGTDAEREIPQADLEWTLQLPSGYTIRRANGTVYTDVLQPHEPAALKVARFLYELAGGVQPFYSAARESARKAGISNNMRQLGSATYEYSDDISPSASTTTSMPPPMMAPGGAEGAQAPQFDSPKEAAPATPPATAAPQDPSAQPPIREPARDQQALKSLQGRISELEATEKAPKKDEKAVEQAGQPADGKKRDTLQGFDTLRIDLQSDHGGQTAVFRSLGADPVLRAAVIDNRRLHAAAWGLALLVLLVGVGMTFQPAGRQASYVILVLLASSVPLLVTNAFDEVAQVFDYVFYAGCALAVYFPLAAFALAVGRWLRSKLPAELNGSYALHEGFVSRSETTTIAGLLIAALVALGSASAAAQEPSSVRVLNLKELLPLLEENPAPVTVPADAVIIPYDPDKLDQPPQTEKLLVPYDKYVELWNRANPDKRILTAARPPADFALAGGAYEATLAAADSLTVRGTIYIDVLTEKPAAVPLQLAGGVLVQATVDGAPARLQVIGAAGATPGQPAPQPQPRQQAANAAPNAEAPPAKMLLLHLSGKGRKKLEITVQLGLTRQGGWRVVRGQLPAGPATALTLVVPAAGTEIRQQGLADRPTFETKAAGERIETSLAAGGLLGLQWRDKVAEGQVDQSLTAKSAAVLDVREDSIRLGWQVRLEFGRALRDAFTFAVPEGYLVEQVTGDNLRGWTAKTVGGEQLIDVTLLKPAQGSAAVTLQLARRGRVGQGELAEFTAPSVTVVDAALQQGEIAVRRSPRLDLRTVAATGLARADADGQTAAVEQVADASDAAVLNVRPYQTFRFVRPPFTLRLAASELATTTNAEVRAALRIAERDTTLDAAVVFHPQGQPLYRVELFLPQGFELDRLGPGDLEWAITTENGRQKLTVHLLEGRTGDFTLTLFGRIVGVGDPPAPDGQPTTRTMPAPVIEVLGVQKQEGDLVVLPDPDTDVRMEEIKNADSVLLMQAIGWLAAEQQHLAKGALRFRSPDYGARLVLTPRTPQVSVRTITNVKVTQRAIEETILLNFKIEQAGIRRLSFLLPESLKAARLNVKLLKSKTVEPATNAAGQPIPGWVRFRLELQDYVRDEFGVIVMNDRLLTADKQPIAIPQVETGRTDQRLVSIEEKGRDEVVASDLSGVEQLTPQQQAWRELTAILGPGITKAFIVTNSAATPAISFQTKERTRAETAAARIDLATTLMVVDASGAYRALQEYRITNATEQFLDVQMPAGARLWTVTVAGRPVKPLVPPPPAGQAATPEGMVRIPLIKTAEGEGDYPVQLKYGGRMPEVTSLSQVNFPLMRTLNINVELSQVKLMLPDSHEWFDFRGTMRKVSDEGELAEVFQSYLNKQIEEASELLASANPYTQMRALSNLKQRAIQLDSSRSMSANNLSQRGLALQSGNEALLAEAEKKFQSQQAAQNVEGGDNRERLNSYWAEQGVKRSKNVVSGLKSNFDADGAEQAQSRGDSTFNKDFFDQNSLSNKAEAAAAKPGADALGKQPEDAFGGKPGGRYFRGGREGKPAAESPKSGDDASGLQGQNPQLFNEQQKQQLQQQLQREVDELRSSQSESRDQDRANLSRYSEQLELKVQQSQELDRAAGARQAGGQQPASGEPGQSMQSGFSAGGGMGAGGGFGLPGGPAAAYAPAGGSGAAPAGRPTAGEDFSAVSAGLASLDFELPQRGKMYHFTTPRGQIEISARPVAEKLLARLIGLAGLAAAVMVVWLVARRPAREFWRRLFGTVACGVLLAVVGLASIVGGVLPLAGLLLLAVGIVLAIRNRCCPPIDAPSVA